MQILSFDNVCFSYNKQTVLKNINLSLSTGEVVCLLGANASGKTTLMNLAVTLLQPFSGEIKWFDGKDRLADVRSRIGYVPQDVALYQNMSVSDNLRFFGKLHGIQGDNLEHALEKTAHITGVDLAEKKKVRHLSGGMRRRANMAAALIHDPTLLIMDEPTVGIDMPSRQAINTALRSLQQEGKAIMFSSHYPDEISVLATKLLILKEGNITSDYCFDALNSPTERMAEAIRQLTFS